MRFRFLSIPRNRPAMIVSRMMCVDRALDAHDISMNLPKTCLIVGQVQAIVQVNCRLCD